MTTTPLLGADALEISLASRRFLIVGIDEAIHLLERQRPVKTGIHYRPALRSCRPAMGSPEPTGVHEEVSDAG